MNDLLCFLHLTQIQWIFWLHNNNQVDDDVESIMLLLVFYARKHKTLKISQHRDRIEESERT
jgi:hypothetical protein